MASEAFNILDLLGFVDHVGMDVYIKQVKPDANSSYVQVQTHPESTTSMRVYDYGSGFTKCQKVTKLREPLMQVMPSDLSSVGYAGVGGFPYGQPETSFFECCYVDVTVANTSSDTIYMSAAVLLLANIIGAERLVISNPYAITNNAHSTDTRRVKIPDELKELPKPLASSVQMNTFRAALAAFIPTAELYAVVNSALGFAIQQLYRWNSGQLSEAEVYKTVETYFLKEWMPLNVGVLSGPSELSNWWRDSLLINALLKATNDSAVIKSVLGLS
jgi:hypothetical protein